MVIFKITLDPQIGSDPFFLSICAREEERKGASGAWELWRPVSLSFSIYNFRIFTTIPLLAWKLQRQASSVRKWCHSSHKDCSIFPNISRPCIHTKSKCQNFHIILYNTIKDRPTMHQIQDNFVHFFLSWNCFFCVCIWSLCILKCWKFIFELKLSFKQYKTAILKKHCRKSLKSALLQKIIVWAPYLKVKGSTWINIIRKHSNLKEIVGSLVWKVETG